MKVKVNTPKGKKWFNVTETNPIETYLGIKLQIHFNWFESRKHRLMDYVVTDIDTFKPDRELKQEIMMFKMQ